MISKNLIHHIKSLLPYTEKNALKNLFSWSELELLLNQRPFMNDKRFHIMSNIKYEWPLAGWLTDSNTYPPNIIQKEIKKYVCYIRDCSRVNKIINDVCTNLEQHTNWPVDAHIFFSLQEPETNTKGFGIHKDNQHNVITCVEGSMIAKVWSTEQNGEPVINTTLQSGDVVFVPANVYHQIIPLTKRLSVSFPMAHYDKSFQERDWITL
jgi:hypothetical protein